ncbi:MAG: acetoacetate decarboxylase family protein [Acidobacteria bacterium]|nr:acetoacetate decarboxylase family protein [Acidobacteriota bacterium]
MSPLTDLKGYAVPFSPQGKAQIVGGLPWNFGVDLIAINFRTDPNEIRKLLPEPLEPSREQPDMAYVWFGDWQGIWAQAGDMLATNPERVQYQECLIGVRCSYQGVEGHRCVYIWVNKDFSMARGWFMGFPKKIGRVHMGSSNRHLHDLNPALGKAGSGTTYAAICEAHGERLVTGRIRLKEKISPKQLPSPFGTDLFHTIHFPSADVSTGCKPLVHQLVQTVSANINFGEVWSAEGEAIFHESGLEEHTAIKPKEIVSAYLIPVGFTIKGTRLIHTY